MVSTCFLGDWCHYPSINMYRKSLAILTMSLAKIHEIYHISLLVPDLGQVSLESSKINPRFSEIVLIFKKVTFKKVRYLKK